MLAELQQKGQITIPKEIVGKLGLNKGDILEISEKDGVICITPVVVYPKKHFDRLLGEIEDVREKISFIAAQGYDDGLFREIEENNVQEKATEDSDSTDAMLEDAIEVVVEAGQASTALLQRRLKLNYVRAARIMDDMEARGIIGPQDGSKARVVNITRQQWLERKMNRPEKTE